MDQILIKRYSEHEYSEADLDANENSRFRRVVNELSRTLTEANQKYDNDQKERDLAIREEKESDEHQFEAEMGACDSGASLSTEEMKRLVLIGDKFYMGGGSYLHVVNLIANVAIHSLELSLKLRQCLLQIKSSPKQKSIFEGIIRDSYPDLLTVYGL